MYNGGDLEFPVIDYEKIGKKNENASKSAQDQWIQFIHDDDDHWVVAGYGFNEIKFIQIFYSLHLGKSINNHVVDCISCIVKTTSINLQIARMPCQSQLDGNNCGVFGLAFGTALAFGQNPSVLVYDVKEIREHIKKCLKEKDIWPFPVKGKRGTKSERVSVLSFKVYCHCRRTDTGFPTCIALCCRYGIMNLVKIFQKRYSK